MKEAVLERTTIQVANKVYHSEEEALKATKAILKKNRGKVLAPTKYFLMMEDASYDILRKKKFTTAKKFVTHMFTLVVDNPSPEHILELTKIFLRTWKDYQKEQLTLTPAKTAE